MEFFRKWERKAAILLTLAVGSACSFAEVFDGKPIPSGFRLEPGITQATLTVRGKNIPVLQYKNNEGTWVGGSPAPNQYMFFKDHDFGKNLFWVMISTRDGLPIDESSKSVVTLAEANCSGWVYTHRQVDFYSEPFGKGRKTFSEDLGEKGSMEWTMPHRGSPIEVWMTDFCSRRVKH